MTAPREPLLRAGTPVEVRNHFEGGWSRGFHIVEVCRDGYRVARGDGTQLPVCVDPADVRAAASGETADVHAIIALDLRTAEATVTIRLSGSLTRITAAQFRELTREVTGPNVLVDLSDVVAVDEAGTAALLALIHRCREERGTVIVVATHREVRRALQQVGVHRVAALVQSAEPPDQLRQGEGESKKLRARRTD